MPEQLTELKFAGRAAEVFNQQNGEVTKAYYAELATLGSHGELAVALFRAQKRSSRAKEYRRSRFRAASYDVKEWSLSEVSRILTAHAKELSVESWGWKEDPEVLFGERASWVLYIELPYFGQVSFHNPTRLAGQAYQAEWDGVKGASEDRIISYCNSLYTKESHKCRIAQ